jgi:CBS domain containing-hemolysin-like protein
LAITDSGEIAAKPAPEPRRSFVERLRTALGLRREEGSLRADLEGALAEEHHVDGEATAFTREERALLRNILGLREVRVADVAVPRADIVAVEHGISLGDLLHVFQEAAHSRLPVYRETLDDPVGMIHIRDLVGYLTTGAPRREDGHASEDISNAAPDLGRIDLSAPLSHGKLIRRVLFVPPSMPVLDLLVQMQTTRIHMALVIDEYGGTDGLVSIEDLIETVVGDIEDEHDESVASVVKGSDGWTASARASLDEVRTVLGNELALVVPEDVADEVDTIGGLVGALAGRVPARGELIRGPGNVEFEVLDADPRRVKRLRIRAASPDPATRKRRVRETPESSQSPLSAADPPTLPQETTRT